MVIILLFFYIIFRNNIYVYFIIEHLYDMYIKIKYIIYVSD